MFLVKRQKLLITLVFLMSIQRLVDLINVTSNEYSDIPYMTTQAAKLRHSLDIYMFCLSMVQLTLVSVALYHWNNYRLSSRLVIVSGLVFLFLPLVLYWIPFTMYLECDMDGLGPKFMSFYDSFNSDYQLVLQAFCSLYLCFQALIANVQVSLPSFAVFPAMMSGSSMLQAFFGKHTSLVLLNRVIAFGFLPLFTIGVGFIWQWYGYLSVLVTYLAVVLYLSTFLMRDGKRLAQVAIVIAAVCALWMMVNLEINIWHVAYKAIPRYYFSTILYSDIGLYFLNYLQNNKTEDLKELELLMSGKNLKVVELQDVSSSSSGDAKDNDKQDLIEHEKDKDRDMQFNDVEFDPREQRAN